MHWNVILADAPAAPAQTTASPPPAQGTSTTQAAQPGQSGQPAAPFGGMGILFPLILIVVMVYFMSIRPQQQRAKQMAKLLSSLKSGDKVITSSGIVGVVITINDKDGTVSIRSKEAKIEVTKSSITEIRQSDDTQTSP
jgi:preprotein translocase subunit YajC